MRQSGFRIATFINRFAFVGLLFMASCATDIAQADNRIAEKTPTSTGSRAGKVSKKIAVSLESKQVEVRKLSAENYARTIEVSGKALAHKESTLSLNVPGLVQKILVSRGDRVKKNQPLLTLDPTGFQLGVQQANGAVSGAQAQEDLMKIETDRLQMLLADGAAPAASRDELQAQVKGADARASIARVTLAQARKALRDSVLRAPYDGVIADIMIEKGEQAPTMPATRLMKIVDASLLEVQVFVSEDASGLVRVGNSAAVTIEAAGVVTEGEIIFVSDSINPGGRTFEVRVAVDNKEGLVKAGAYARVRFTNPWGEAAIFIPVSAMQRDADGKSFVFVASGGVASRREITLGVMQGTRVQATAGLSIDDELIVTNAGSLNDGEPISPAKNREYPHVDL